MHPQILVDDRSLGAFSKPGLFPAKIGSAFIQVRMPIFPGTGSASRSVSLLGSGDVS